MITFILIIIALIVVEIVLINIIKYLRIDFQWLITAEDENPKLDNKGLHKFLSNSYCPDLGWVRKKNSSGTEKDGDKRIVFKIDNMGSRISPNTGKYSPSVACFGDSYAFCRQVNNDETWEYLLGKSLKTEILNFGVGNYGLDQSLLRYKNTTLPKTVKTVIIAVVPETICRIQSYWKHYLEFGNTFAFKPMFILKNNKLKLLKNLMKKKEDFYHYEKKLSSIKLHDRFYEEKFKKLQFRFPYILSFFRNFVRNSFLMYHLILKKILNLLNLAESHIDEKPFRYIMENNIKLSHNLYDEKYSRELFKALLRDYSKVAKKKNHRAIFILLPQLVDFYVLEKTKKNSYSEFINELNISDLEILDITNDLSKRTHLESYYINDNYGGHMSKEGNAIIAENLKKILKDINAHHV